MTCSCGAKATREIRDVPLCAEHYLEALEHGAMIVTPMFDAKVVEKLQEEIGRVQKIKEYYLARQLAKVVRRAE